MSRRTLNLNNQVYDYLLSRSLKESSILQQLRLETAKHPLAKMQIAPEQGQFLAFLVKILKVTKAIEIGVFTGYSSLAIAEAMPQHGRLIACDIDAETTKTAQRYWEQAGVNDKIELHISPALATLDRLISQSHSNSFDFAFIDAHKPEYIDYYERILQLLRPGGVIVVDNVLWSGHVADPTKQDEDTVAIRKFNNHIYNDKRVFISMLAVADGITLITKN